MKIKSTNSQEIIDRAINDYGKNEDATISLLQAIQKEYGYLPLTPLSELCQKTHIHANRLFGVATFYAQFTFQPKGQHVIKICAGTACHVKGEETLLAVIDAELGIQPGQTTPDQRFSLETVACLGCCSLAPVMMIDDVVYGKLTPDKLRMIFKQHG